MTTRVHAFSDDALGDLDAVGLAEHLKAGKLSAESPVAQALLGTKVGKVAKVTTPRGERRLRVESVG